MYMFWYEDGNKRGGYPREDEVTVEDVGINPYIRDSTSSIRENDPPISKERATLWSSLSFILSRSF